MKKDQRKERTQRNKKGIKERLRVRKSKKSKTRTAVQRTSEREKRQGKQKKDHTKVEKAQRKASNRNTEEGHIEQDKLRKTKNTSGTVQKRTSSLVQCSLNSFCSLLLFVSLPNSFLFFPALPCFSCFSCGEEAERQGHNEKEAEKNKHLYKNMKGQQKSSARQLFAETFPASASCFSKRASRSQSA